MKLLIVGGAGYVGSILRPTFEARYQCQYLDLVAPPGAEDRTIIGDLNDRHAVRRAVYQQDAIVFLAMGKNTAQPQIGVFDHDAAFRVNVQGHWHVFHHALMAGMRRFVYASTLSVYNPLSEKKYVDENTPPDAFHEVYGLTKRLGETINDMAAQKYSDATLVSLRLMWPRTEADWPGNEYKPGLYWYPTGPHDLRRLFVSALEFRLPGHYAIQASGDLGNDAYPNREATRLLGWAPEGR